MCGVVPAECRGYRGELSTRTGWRWTVSSGVVLIEGLNEGSESSYIFTEASDLRVVMRNCRDGWGGYFHHPVSHVSELSEVHVSCSGSEDHTNIGWKAL